ncbi:DUF2334 domain-containing protein [Luteolibacter sp. LG18]|uniref:DUF2334 domain-containing protein n=1 Tax=Luteolibacter sp. LG18 TaxID=2819286 RepID=UPI002B2DA4AE|nr:hypothetical protein llg_07480 [Luteolibacter sp. LG18]
MDRELDLLLEAFPESARSKAMVLVVPDWSGRYPLDRHPAFVQRLKVFPGRKVLHGYTHTLGPDLFNTLFYGTENHSEFASLSRAEARERLEKSRDLFATALGETPSWFCAPRWEQNAVVRETLVELGFEGFMLSNRYETVSGGRVEMPAVCFDDGGLAWRHTVNRSIRRVQLRRWIESGTTFRLTLHPAELSQPKTWRQVVDLMAELQDQGWQPLEFSMEWFR